MKLFALKLSAVSVFLVAMFAIEAARSDAIIVPLPDGATAQMESAAEDTQPSRAWVATFVLSKTKVMPEHDSLIAIADLLFEQAVLVPADVNGHVLAIVRIRSPNGRKREDFQYARQEDRVWLRQAGKEAWKRAERRDEWTAPDGGTIDLGAAGEVTIEFVGEMVPPPQKLHALGIVMHSAVPVSDREGKYREVKALYERLDKKKLTDDNFDHVAIVDFEGAALGRFYVRQSAVLAVSRRIGDEWPMLPETAPGSTPPALTTSLVPAPGAEPPRYSAQTFNAASPSMHLRSIDAQLLLPALH